MESLFNRITHKLKLLKVLPANISDLIKFFKLTFPRLRTAFNLGQTVYRVRGQRSRQDRSRLDLDLHQDQGLVGVSPSGSGFWLEVQL